MSVKVSISPNQAAYLPGDIVLATVKVWNEASTADGSGAVVITELVVESFGVERIDPHWVNKLYLPSSPPDRKDGRRLLRTLFTSEPAQLLTDTHLAEGAMQQFVVRFRLPWRLPPTFKGNSVRFNYSLTVGAKYCLAKHSEAVAMSKQGSAGLDNGGDSRSSTGRLSALLARSYSQPLSSPPLLESKATATTLLNLLPFVVKLEDKRLRERSMNTPTPTGDDGDQHLIEYELNQVVKLRWEAVPESGSTLSLPSLSGRVTSQFLPSQTPMSQAWDAIDEDSSVISRSVLESDDEDFESAGMKIASPTGHTPRSPIVGPRGNSASRTYNLRMGDGQLLKFMLQPPLEGPLQPGRTFGGVLDFRVARADDPTSTSPKCIQVCVLLETEENIPAEHMHNTRSASQNLPIRKLYCEHQEPVLDSVLSHFMFTIPTSAPASFRTPMVTLRWVLRFELTTGVVLPGNASDRTVKPLTDVLVWTLPVIVQPAIHM